MLQRFWHMFQYTALAFLGQKIGQKTESRWSRLFKSLIVEDVHKFIVPKFDTDSCLNSNMQFDTRKANWKNAATTERTWSIGREFKQVSHESSVHQQHNTLKMWVSKSLDVPRRQYVQAWEPVKLRMMFSICLFQQKLNARPMRPFSSDVNDTNAIAANHADYRLFLQQFQTYANLLWGTVRKEYLPVANNRQKRTTDLREIRPTVIWFDCRIQRQTRLLNPQSSFRNH